MFNYADRTRPAVQDILADQDRAAAPVRAAQEARAAELAATRQAQLDEYARRDADALAERLAAEAEAAATATARNEAATNAAADERLGLQREIRYHEWAGQHPTRTRADFDREVWPHERAALLLHEQAATQTALRQGGRYSL